jgi:phage head maturation protease
MTLSDNLVRALAGPTAMQIRSAGDGGGNTLFGHFAVFNRWTEINNMWEGNFLERVAPSAFDGVDPSRVKVLFDHGADPSVGSKPLGVLTDFRADGEVGQAYSADLFDAGYVNDLKPAIAAGTMGASFRFSVPDGGDEWTKKPERSEWNPDGLPERTLTKLNLFEFGPVVFPAYADASAGLRSMTPEFYARLDDPSFVASLAERVGHNVVQRMLAAKRDIVVVTDDDADEGSECCCSNCGVMFDTAVAPACPVCQTPAAGDAPGSAEMNSADVPAPRGLSLHVMQHQLLLIQRSRDARPRS